MEVAPEGVDVLRAEVGLHQVFEFLGHRMILRDRQFHLGSN